MPIKRKMVKQPFDDGIAFGVDNGVLHSYDVGDPKTTLYEKKVGTILRLAASHSARLLGKWG